MLAVAAVLGIVPGLQRSLEIIGPASTFCLPVLAVAALWWKGWPLARLSRPGAGLAALGLIVVSGIALTAIGQAVTGKFQLSHLFGTAAEAARGHMATFPWTVPLAAFVFVTMLQLTFVCRQWPFQRLSPVAGGFAALATSWMVGLAGYGLLAGWDFVPAAARHAIGLRNPGGPVNALDLVGILLCVVIIQMTVFFLLEGYPVSLIKSQPLYLAAANAATIGGGILLWWALNLGLGLSSPQVSEVAGVIVAGTLIAGLLFEGWPARTAGNPAWSRLALLGMAGAVAVAAGFALRAISLGATWTGDPPQLWVAVTSLNFIGAFVIVHAAVFRRWPLPSADPGPPGR
ncbi:MAG: hypothetical protein ACRDOB_05175 [Streptosporangiaceae bacterium]